MDCNSLGLPHSPTIVAGNSACEQALYLTTKQSYCRRPGTLHDNYILIFTQPDLDMWLKAYIYQA